MPVVRMTQLETGTMGLETGVEGSLSSGVNKKEDGEKRENKEREAAASTSGENSAAALESNFVEVLFIVSSS
ncbi:hypothetical protein K0M31_012209 [Melipona bicolor]|uniref:Uncharacterized protein n=1 Tax=Melipona bicolor TaxID=60889 RepID=A0AA40FKB7_9HYME|nr:hypothetical protein K0M31_012209 [Melipona bicolor]